MAKNISAARDEKKDSSSVMLIDRTFAVLELVSSQGTVSLKDIYSSLNLNKASTLRIANALTENGYLIRDESGSYSMSFKAYEVGLRALRRVEYISFIREALDQMAGELNAVAQFSVRAQSELLCLESFDLTRSNFSVYTQVGQRSQLYATSAGKAILSTYPDEAIRNLWQTFRVQPFTPRTITTLDAFMEEIYKTRRRGYAIDNEEHEPGLFCVGAPLINAAQDTVGAISLSVNRMDEAELQRLSTGLLAQIQRLSYLLKYSAG